MDIETLKKIKKLKADLIHKLNSENKKFKWFYENRIIGTGLTYSSFMGSLNGNGGNVRNDVQSAIDKYLDERA